MWYSLLCSFHTCMDDGLRANSPVAVRNHPLHQGKQRLRPLPHSRPPPIGLRSKIPCFIYNNFFYKDVNASRCVSRLMGKLFILPMYRDDAVAAKNNFLFIWELIFNVIEWKFLELRFTWIFGRCLQILQWWWIECFHSSEN